MKSLTILSTDLRSPRAVLPFARNENVKQFTCDFRRQPGRNLDGFHFLPIRRNAGGESFPPRETWLDSPVLEQGEENGRLLGLGSGTNWWQIWGDWCRQAEGSTVPSSKLDNPLWIHSRRSIRAPSLRQPRLCKTRPPVPRNTPRQHAGHDEKGPWRISGRRKQSELKADRTGSPRDTKVVIYWGNPETYSQDVRGESVFYFPYSKKQNVETHTLTAREHTVAGTCGAPVRRMLQLGVREDKRLPAQRKAKHQPFVHRGLWFSLSFHFMSDNSHMRRLGISSTFFWGELLVFCFPFPFTLGLGA